MSVLYVDLSVLAILLTVFYLKMHLQFFTRLISHSRTLLRDGLKRFEVKSQ